MAACITVFAAAANALEPISCPAGAPIGSFQLTVTNDSGTAVPRTFESINQLLSGYRIDYHPVTIKGAEKKKARFSLVLVPSDKGKLAVLDPQPANEDEEWTVPFQTSIAAVVFGPAGLDKGKVTKLVMKNDELIGQLADYAQKTQQTEALIQAITDQQQSLESSESVNAAVVSFANQYPGAPKLDRTQPVDAQMATLLHGLNPAVSAYDPLTPDPAQRAAQSASIAAAVAGLFLGTDVGLGASAGALLLNMHSLFFPRTEFRSAFGQPQSAKNVTALCGSKGAAPSRTQIAFLWATRLPDTSAPNISLAETEHLPIGEKASVPLEVKARDPKLATRVQDWELSSADGKISAPANAKVSTDGKTIALDLNSAKLKPGAWKLKGVWDWTPVEVQGDIELHPLSTFAKAHVDSNSHDRLVHGSGKVLVSLTGDDFEFVNKLSFKSSEDKFAQPATIPFILPKGPHAGPQDTLETQIDTQSLEPGKYEFLVAQTDGTPHPVPFQVLPAPPQISNLPLLVNTGQSSHVVLRGQGLDRIQSITADGAKIALDESAKPDERGATVTLDAGAKPGQKLKLLVTAKDFDQPISLPDAIVIAGPAPAIGNIRASLPQSAVALAPGEIPADSSVSFEFAVANAPRVTSVDVYCEAATAGKTVKIREGQAGDAGRLREEGSGVLFLAFNPASIGQPGCAVMAKVHSAQNGDSAPKKLGQIVLLPRIDSFQLTDQKAGDNAFYGEIKGQNLESIAKVGWDSNLGIAVDSIPAPVAGAGDVQLLQVRVPWPAPAPHAPLFIWLRDEDKGRATTVKW